MKTDAIIDELRKLAKYGQTITTMDRRLIEQAAEALEELEDKKNILLRNMDETWGRGEG